MPRHGHTDRGSVPVVVKDWTVSTEAPPTASPYTTVEFRAAPVCDRRNRGATNPQVPCILKSSKAQRRMSALSVSHRLAESEVLRIAKVDVFVV